MLSNAEITEIIDAVNNETYTIVDALNELAKAAKGEDVRRALYAVAYLLNEEGHSGSVDLQAREGLQNLTTSVNSEISEFEEDINDSVSAMQTQINNIDTSRRALVIDTLATLSGNGEGRQNQVIALSQSIAGYQYVQFYAKHDSELLPVSTFPVNAITVSDTLLRISSIGYKYGRMFLKFDDNTHVRITQNLCYSRGSMEISYASPSTEVSNDFIRLAKIVGIKTL